MSDSLLEQENLTTADIAHPATSRETRTATINRNLASLDQQADGSLTTDDNKAAIPLPASTPTAASNTAGATGNATVKNSGPLFPDDELHNYRARWDQVQTSFVDEPRQAVAQADSLVANVVKRIAEQFAAERAGLEEQWAKGDDVSTEDLRQAFRRYRSFFDRLLSF